MAATREQVQERLKALGYYDGEIDGDFGNRTLQGLWDALGTAKARSVVVVVPAPSPKGARLLPKQWLQPATIKRVHLHCQLGDQR
jgi:hypothetical protein